MIMDTQDRNAEGCCHRKWHHRSKCGSAVYCFGFIGASFYYNQHAMTFWAGVIGVLKAIVWPAFLVYKALAFLSM